VLRDGTARAADGHPTAFTERPWPASLDPANLLELTRRDPVLGTGQVRAILEERRVGRDPPGSYRFRLIRAYAQPLVPVVMLLLATPVAGGQRRSGGIAAGMAVGLATGLSYLVLDGILAALGETGTLPPLLAAWAAHAVFASIGGALLLRAEG
jgi:lipopolysaccharide export system permease protein